MKKRLKATLSVNSINSLIKELEVYKSDLDRKCELFIQKLAENSISVAKSNVGNFGKYITFSVKTEPNKTGCRGILLATNTGIIKSEWKTLEGAKSADVSPLLMVEFGSGIRAENPMDVSGVGTGTFPGSTHGTDPSGWWWMDLEGIWHHSYGVTPKAPMYHATMEMHQKVVTIAKGVFGQ